MDTQNDGLEKEVPLEYGILNFWGYFERSLISKPSVKVTKGSQFGTKLDRLEFCYSS